MPRHTRVPSYRLHKPSGQAVVTLSSCDIYLGPYNSPQSRQAYERTVAEWLASGRQPPRNGHGHPLTVTELCVAYYDHAIGYYHPHTVSYLQVTLRRFRKLYGDAPAAAFGPVSLRAFQQSLIEEGLSRPSVNKGVHWVKQMFTWAVSMEMLSPDQLTGLRTIGGLKRGRSAARETDPVRPVEDAVVDATIAELSPVVADMVRVQRLTGMRPGELVSMRVGDLDQTGEVWTYRPRHHKTAHHGHVRSIHLGPRAQAVLNKRLADAIRHGGERYVFSPNDAPKEPRSRNTDGPCYSVASYRRAIARACKRAGVEVWSPNRLRHTKATELRAEFGLDVAGAVLGHSRIETTQVYAERSNAAAAMAASKTG